VILQGNERRALTQADSAARCGAVAFCLVSTALSRHRRGASMPAGENVMRITGGEHRGRRIHIPASKNLRPALERVREAIFNILRDRLAEARVLDCFAGTGLLGLECLSRGAAEVVFVELHRLTAQRIKELVADWNLADRATVIPGDFLRLARSLAAKGPYDLVFVDPPYPKHLVDASLEVVAKANLIGPDGIVILKQSRREEMTPPPDLIITDQRLYGDSKVTFLRTKGAQ
jgi:16S rRNA (guanine966-N2)-methyltransferase